MIRTLLFLIIITLAMPYYIHGTNSASIQFIFEQPAKEKLLLFTNTIGRMKPQNEVCTSENVTMDFQKHASRYMYISTDQKTYTAIYIEEGKQLKVRYQDDQLTFEGDLANEVEYLNQSIQKSARNVVPYSRESLDIKKERLQERLCLLDKADVSKLFKSREEQRLKLTHYYSLVNSPAMMAMFGSEQFDLCDNYYSFLEEMSFDSEAVVDIPGWYKPMFDIFLQMEKEGLIDANVDNFLLVHTNRINNQKLKEEYVLAGLDFLLQHDYRDNIDQIASNAFQVIKSEDATRRYHHIMDQFNPLKEKYASLAKGQMAPDFEAVDPYGDMYRLSNFRGKVVLLDMWFLGCAPCKTEMPYLKKLENELHSDNSQCITLSLDRKQDIEKWKDYITEHRLTGLQLNEPNGFKASVAKDYMLRGVPRYIVIDKEGKIYDAFARRPSDPKLKKMLEELL